MSELPPLPDKRAAEQAEGMRIRRWPLPPLPMQDLSRDNLYGYTARALK